MSSRRQSQRIKGVAAEDAVAEAEPKVVAEAMVIEREGEGTGYQGEGGVSEVKKGSSSQACSGSEDTEECGNTFAIGESKQRGQMTAVNLEPGSGGGDHPVEAGSAERARGSAPCEVDQVRAQGVGQACVGQTQEGKRPKSEKPARRGSTSTLSSQQGGRKTSSRSSAGTKSRRSSASGSVSSGSKSRRAKPVVSKYRGVAVHRWTGRWEAHIWENGKQLYLGSFETEEQAARAYDKAAIKLKKDNAVLNFKLEEYQRELESLAEMTKEELITSLRRDSAGFARGTSHFRGVSWRAQTGRYEARIGRLLGRKYTYLGTFKSGEDAARAYDHAAIVSRGREAITNYHLSEYKEKLEEIEKATPEERRRMEEEIILRPQAVGAKQRRKRFEASTSDSQISGKSQTSLAEKEDIIQEEDMEERRFKRIKSCPPAMLSDKLGVSSSFERNISVNFTLTTQELEIAGIGTGGCGPAGPKALAPAKRSQQSQKKQAKVNQRKYERTTTLRERTFQRSLTGNVRLPTKVNNPSLPHQVAYAHEGRCNQPQMGHHYTGPTFKPNPPSAIEKLDLLMGDYFSGLPDGSHHTWSQTISDIEQGYPEPIGAMLGMTACETNFMPPGMVNHPPGFHQRPADQHGPIFNGQVPTQNMFHWNAPNEQLQGSLGDAQGLSDLDRMMFQEGDIPIENIRNTGVKQEEINPMELKQEMNAMDGLDGPSMTNILMDLGFAGDNLFTWHT
ncbi:AP2-like ethylene-responsive transcription factor [Chloropicon primus]|nr:AP2-like ethylene-responsive transcription factor [Chloropicon primus]